MKMTIFRQNDQPIDSREMAEMKMTIFRHLKLSWNENDQTIDKRGRADSLMKWKWPNDAVFDIFMKWKWLFFDKMTTRLPKGRGLKW